MLRARVVHIGADAGRLGRGAQGTGHKAGWSGVLNLSQAARASWADLRFISRARWAMP